MIDYESPIKIWQSELEMQMEDEMLNVCRRVGVQVDKDELLKALEYDRNQYDKGYQDGLNADKWISCEERLPEKNNWYIVTAVYKDVDTTDRCFWNGKEWLKHNFKRVKEFNDEIEIIAWQPFPQEYKKSNH